MRITTICAIVALIALMPYYSSAMVSASVPGAYITGYVLDEDGKPVPFANVSLWEDGHLWEQTKYLYSNGSTQLSRMTYNDEWDALDEGGFVFGYVYPGDYTLKAEKDGCNGTANVTVYSNTTTQFVVNPTAVPVDLTLKGYHLPTLTPEQQAYTGAIAGNIWSDHGAGNIWSDHGYRITHARVTLWKDGQKVDRLDNPQGAFTRNYSGVEVDYLFDHLAPGSYIVSAENDAGLFINGTVAVNVSSRPMRADMVVIRLKAPPPGYDPPDINVSPTVGEFSAHGSQKASPGILLWMAALAIGTAAYLIQRTK